MEKNKETYRLRIRQMLAAALLPLLFAGCLYEQVELTDEGEWGIDPTDVTLNANLSFNLPMPAFEEGGETLQRPYTEGKPAYRHRFVVEAYVEHVLAARQVTYAEIEEGQKQASLSVSMKLHARDYEIAVWSDYVQVPDEEKGVNGTDEYFWNTTASHLLTVYGGNTYRSCDDYKDAFCGSVQVDLTGYRNEWNAKESIDLQLERPVARVAFVANDVDAFLRKLQEDKVTDSNFTIRLRYTDYLNMGYNVPERLPRHGLMYISTDRKLAKKTFVAGQPLTLIWDYVLAADGENTVIPVTLEVLNAAKSQVLASTSLNLYCKAGRHTTLTYGFLTSTGDGGITFNPDFDGKEDITVPARPAGGE